MVRKITALLFALGLAAGCSIEAGDQAAAEVLVADITYTYVGLREETDANGNKLEWQAVATGELGGTFSWWFKPTPSTDSPYNGGELTFYSAFWELRDGDRLVIRGRSAGKTDVHTDSDGVWDGHGVVTDAAPEYASLVGRRIYETGTVEYGDDPPATFTGHGMFAVIGD